MEALHKVVDCLTEISRRHLAVVCINLDLDQIFPTFRFNHDPILTATVVAWSALMQTLIAVLYVVRVVTFLIVQLFLQKWPDCPFSRRLPCVRESHLSKAY